MKKSSFIEDIFEISVKKPSAGLILCIFFGVVGLFLSNKQAPVGAKPNEIIFLPAMHMIGMISYILSAIVLILAAIGYIVTTAKRKKKIRVPRESPIGSTTSTSKPSQFASKEEYFRWKESLMNKSADKDPGEEELPQEQDEVSFIKAAKHIWNPDAIYYALEKIDWYEFEKFCASLLRNEGYDVERKGGAQPDGGVDLIASKDNETMFVQCKHWKTWEIKPKTVREMIGTMKINDVSSGAIYTLKGASKAAMDLATEQGIVIEEGYALADRAFRQLSKEQLDSILNMDVHHCPKCEAEMVWREGNFKSFWGCSRYPRCRGKLEYTGAR